MQCTNCIVLWKNLPNHSWLQVTRNRTQCFKKLIFLFFNFSVDQLTIIVVRNIRNIKNIKGNIKWKSLKNKKYKSSSSPDFTSNRKTWNGRHHHHRRRRRRRRHNYRTIKQIYSRKYRNKSCKNLRASVHGCRKVIHRKPSPASESSEYFFNLLFSEFCKHVWLIRQSFKQIILAKNWRKL